MRMWEKFKNNYLEYSSPSNGTINQEEISSTFAFSFDQIGFGSFYQGYWAVND